MRDSADLPSTHAPTTANRQPPIYTFDLPPNNLGEPPHRNNNAIASQPVFSLASAMFTTKLSRAAPRATAALPSTSSATAQQTTRCLATRPSHQRRHSSSKTSAPPDSTAKSKGDAAAAPAPAEKKRTVHRRSGGGVTASKRKEEVDQFAGLPSVPALQGLDLPEVVNNLSIASFFSLHRPISLTTPVPPIVSEKTFSSIFSGRSQQDPWRNGNSAERRPEDIIITLNNTIEMLEGNQNQAENDGVRWEVLNESPSNSEGSVKHLDGAPQPRMKSLDELVANFRPFRAPPPPEPFDEKYARPSSLQKKNASTTATTAKKARKPKQKIYVTEIRVTESTHSDGRKTYAASSTPIRRLEEQQAPIASRQAFLDRMRRRSERAMRDELAKIRKPMYVRQTFGMGRRRTEKWFLISVKRQRKLKMKKHKHKKLMKRTRNLRRRLGRT